MEYTATDALQKEVYVSSWGYASSGQIGNVKYENFTINPNMIEVGDSEISKVAAGESHTIFTDSKTVYGCGSKKFGQLGVGEEEKLLKVYHKAKGLDGLEIDQVFAGGEHSFAITTKGEVYSWGLNFKGQLGSGSFDNRYIPELVDNF